MKTLLKPFLASLAIAAAVYSMVCGHIQDMKELELHKVAVEQSGMSKDFSILTYDQKLNEIYRKVSVRPATVITNYVTITNFISVSKPENIKSSSSFDDVGIKIIETFQSPIEIDLTPMSLKANENLDKISERFKSLMNEIEKRK